jgi:hypothetical protein
MESLGKVIAYTSRPEQQAVLLRQADMIWRGSENSITEADDLAEVRSRYEHLQGRNESFPATAGAGDPLTSAP